MDNAGTIISAQNVWETTHLVNAGKDLNPDFVHEGLFQELRTKDPIWQTQQRIPCHWLETVQGGDRPRLPQDKPVTPVNKDVLQCKLKGYDVSKRKFLTEGFSVGFRLGFSGMQETRISKKESGCENSKRS